MKVIPDGASAADPTVMECEPSPPPKMAVFAAVQATLLVPLFQIRLVAERSQIPLSAVMDEPSPLTVSQVKFAPSDWEIGVRKRDKAVNDARGSFMDKVQWGPTGLRGDR